MNKHGDIPFTILGDSEFKYFEKHVLINENGIVEEVYYYKKDIADHFEFDKVKEFSLLFIKYI